MTGENAPCEGRSAAGTAEADAAPVMAKEAPAAPRNGRALLRWLLFDVWFTRAIQLLLFRPGLTRHPSRHSGRNTMDARVKPAHGVETGQLADERPAERKECPAGARAARACAAAARAADDTDAASTPAAHTASATPDNPAAPDDPAARDAYGAATPDAAAARDAGASPSTASAHPAAASAATAASAAPTAAAPLGQLYAEVLRLFLVQDVERTQADVRKFLLAENDDRREWQAMRRLIHGRYGRGRCSTGQGQGSACRPEKRESFAATTSLILLGARHSGTSYLLTGKHSTKQTYSRCNRARWNRFGVWVRRPPYKQLNSDMRQIGYAESPAARNGKNVAMAKVNGHSSVPSHPPGHRLCPPEIEDHNSAG
jgi:hypothetical protein